MGVSLMELMEILEQSGTNNACPATAAHFVIFALWEPTNMDFHMENACPARTPLRILFTQKQPGPQLFAPISAKRGMNQ